MKKKKVEYTVEYSAKNIKNILSKPVNIKYLKNQKPSIYDYAYNPILKHFKHISQQSLKEWLTCGASQAYTWMPRRRKLKLHKNFIGCALSSLREIKNHKDKYFAQDDESIIMQLKALKDFINNSVVGTSKFLHFSYPTVFPIWDSLVKKAFSKEPKTLKRTRSPNSAIRHYIEYARSIHEICDDYKDLVKSLDIIPVLANKKPLRKIEYALFLVGRMYKEQENERKKKEREKKKDN